MTTRSRRFARVLANGETTISACLALAASYYLVLREELPQTSLGRTYGDPWDSLVVIATLLSSVAVLAGTGERYAMRVAGLIGICTIVLLLDLTYWYQRGPSVAAYAILSNLGIVLFFAARAWLIATAFRA